VGEEVGGLGTALRSVNSEPPTPNFSVGSWRLDLGPLTQFFEVPDHAFRKLSLI
jgi:hypothetical protein